MAETEIEIIAKDGQVEIILFDDDDDMTVLSFDPLDAAQIAATIFDAIEEIDT